MCGIAGWIDWDADLTRERPTLAAMCGQLVCRGPDAEGSWVTPHAAFVHRRLIVIDPEGGRQPMVRPRVVLPPGPGMTAGGVRERAAAPKLVAAPAVRRA